MLCHIVPLCLSQIRVADRNEVSCPDLPEPQGPGVLYHRFRFSQGTRWFLMREGFGSSIKMFYHCLVRTLATCSSTFSDSPISIKAIDVYSECIAQLFFIVTYLILYLQQNLGPRYWRHVIAIPTQNLYVYISNDSFHT